MSVHDVLVEGGFFAGMADEHLASITRCAGTCEFAADEILFRADQAADSFYLVRSGRIAVELAAPGRGPLVIETIGPGDLVGVSWLLPPYTWAFDARAVSATEAVVVDAACLRGICDDDPGLGYELYKRFAGVIRHRLVATRLQTLDLYGRHAS